ncbi:MAG: AAA family ATPase [Planctomycetaceae bacterium]
MYEAFWGFTSKPFGGRQALEAPASSRSQQTALLRLNYAFDNGSRAAAVVGSCGLGKSQVIRLLKAERPERRNVISVVFPSLSPLELLRIVADDINPGHSSALESAPMDAVLLSIRTSLRRLADGLHQQGGGRQTVICFDDAHLLSSDAMTCAIQSLLNLADIESRSELCVVLAGQPVLVSRLVRQPQLNERIGVVATLQGFGFAEMVNYVTSQLASVGCSRQVFTEAALRSLYDLSHGNPRRINRLCDMALLVGCADRCSEITERELEAVAAELMPAAA